MSDKLRIGPGGGDLNALVQFAKKGQEGTVALGRDDGGTFLYIKPATTSSSSSSTALVFPKLSQSERDAVREQLGDHIRVLAKANGLDPKLADDLLTNVRKDQGFTKTNLKNISRELEAAADVVTQMRYNNIPRLDSMLKQHKPIGPALDNLANGFRGVSVLNATKAAEALAKELSAALAAEMVGMKGPDSLAQLIRCPLPFLDSDLSDALRQKGLDEQTTKMAVTKVMQELQGARVARAIELSPSEWGLVRASVDNDTNEIAFADGSRISPTHVFGDASDQNHVARYPTSVGGSMVVKRMGPAGSDTAEKAFSTTADRQVSDLAEALREVQASVRAGQSGNSHLLGGVQHALAPNGQVLIFMRDMPGGTADALTAKLAQARNAQTLPPERIERIVLTMTKDMLTGVAALHAEGLAHLDLKPKNMFVDRHGNGVVADFGSARDVRHELTQGNLPKVDNPLYKAPEFIVQTNLASTKLEERVAKLQTQLKAEHAPILLYMKAQPGEKPHLVGKAADLFSVALSGYEMLRGKLPFEPKDDFPSEIENMMASWSGVPVQQGGVAASAALFGVRKLSGDSALPGLERANANSVEGFLNVLGHRNPAQRPSAQEALSHPAVQGLKPDQEAQAREDIRRLLGLEPGNLRAT